VVCALLSEEELWARAGFRKWVRTGSIVLAAAALTWALGFDRLLPYRWGWGLDESDFPAAAADLLEKGGYPERLYNGYGWGGYLAFRLHPDVGIFQDGRTIAYPRDYLTRLNAGFSFGDWPALLREYDVNTALALRSEAERRFPSGEWGTVFWDDRWVLLVRRSPGNEDLLGEQEYRHFLPGAPLSFADGRNLELLAGEMERNQMERRGRSAVTDNNLGVLYRRLGEEGRAEEVLLKAVAADDSYAPAWANLGALYLAGGERAMAVDALERALLADPGLTSAAALLERLRSAKEPL
jgi:tetratricopeptide (TPR) repeat protein